MKKSIIAGIIIGFIFCSVGPAAFAESDGVKTWAERKWARSALFNSEAVMLVDTSKFKKEPPYKIGFSNVSVSNSYGVFSELQYKARAEYWKEKGMISEFFYTDAQDRPDKQISDIEDLLVKGVDCLIIRAATEAALDPIVTRNHKRGIPQVCFARRVKSDNFVSFVTSSLRAQGRIQTVWLAQMLGEKGNIVILMGKAGSGSTEERRRAFEEALKYYPNINVLDLQYTKYSPAVGKKVMAAMIQKFGDKIDGVLTDNGLQARGAVEAMHEAGIKLPITGCMVNGYMKRVHQWGFEACAVSYPPSLASDSVDVALLVLQGIPVPFNYEMKRRIVCTTDTADVKTDMPWEAVTYMDQGDDFWADNTLPSEWIPK